MWVELQALEVEIGGMEAKEGDNISAGHAFVGCDRGGKV